MGQSTLKTLVTVLTFNEGEKLQKLYADFPKEHDYDILFVNDGSTDSTGQFLKDNNLRYVNHNKNLGVGAGIRTATAYAKEHNYNAIVIMAGNGKMIPSEIDRLLLPIQNNSADYVQGSRYLDGGDAPHLPAFRNIAIKMFTAITNLILGFKGSDITCGFRAYNLSIFDNEQIDIHQDWLGQYEMEYYIHFKVIKAGFRVVEVPVSMVYKKGIKMNGKNPLLLYAYGSYGSTVDPYFSTVRLSLLDRGFIFAIAHVRGSEYLGRDWYEDGKLFNKKKDNE